MSNNIAKIRLKLGQMEVEYEGEASFLHKDLLVLIENIAAFYTENRRAIPEEPAPGGNASASGNGIDLDHSTNTIATYLGVESGPELAIAAAAHLGLIKGKDKFTRKEISREMRGATTFFNENMGRNLSRTLTSLVKGKRLNLVGKDTYALSASERQSLETNLAQ